MSYTDAELTDILENDYLSADIKLIGLKFVLGLTATIEGLHHVVENKDYITAVLKCSMNEEHKEMCRVAHNCFINISAEEFGAFALNQCKVIKEFLKNLQDRDNEMVDLKCQTLSNVTRVEKIGQELGTYFLSSVETFSKLMDLFVLNDSNSKGKYDYLALFFANLSAVQSGKNLLLMKDRGFAKSILPYTTYADSEIRRVGASILLKNICFEIEHHMWLLEEIDILPSLLLPLAGPEDLDADEMECLPLELQYLGTEKKRDSVLQVRVTLLGALLKLCSTEFGRKYMRDKGAYIILRELHKWETKPDAIEACEDVVEILIREESEINCDDLMNLKIPDNIQEKFDKEIENS